MKPNSIQTDKKATNNLAIYQKYMELIYYTNDIIKKFPKSETFALVKEIKDTLYCGLRKLVYAIKVYRITEKLNVLNELDINLSLLKVYIRLSFRYKYISSQNYSSWSNIITDISNMLGGWINSCQKR